MLSFAGGAIGRWNQVVLGAAGAAAAAAGPFMRAHCGAPAAKPHDSEAPFTMVTTRDEGPAPAAPPRRHFPPPAASTIVPVSVRTCQPPFTADSESTYSSSSRTTAVSAGPR